MNILIVNMSVDSVFGGGTVERTRQLAKELQKMPDTDVKVLSTTAGLREGDAVGSQFILLPCLNQRWYVPAPYFGVIYKSLRWADIVIIIGHWTLLNAMVYVVNKLVKRPYLFCPAGALHIFGRSGLVKKVYNGLVGKAILQHADMVIAIPKDEQKLFQGQGVEKTKISIIPNGISPEDFEHSDDQGVRVKYGLRDAPFLLFMGRLNEIKGPDILLDAFIKLAPMFPDWELVFAGPDGGMEKVLKETLSESKLENRVHFVGFVSGELKSDLYHAASILVIPSRLEAMSIVALEAGICGTPVVMTNECGFSELVDAKGGVEVSASSESLSGALEKLMSDMIRTYQMGLNAKSFINLHYTWEIAAKRHRALCVDMLQEKGDQGSTSV